MKKNDLSALDTARGAEQGFTIQLRDPAGNATDMEITVLGAESDAYVAKEREILRRRQKEAERGRKYKLPALEEIEADALELMVVVTTGWTNIELDGQAVPFNADSARMLYKRFRWIREQVDAAISDRANFLPRAATA